jgi:hypothetical protein
MEGRFHNRFRSRDTVRLVLAPALVFIVASLDRGYQTDFWQHLARGRLIAREHALVSADRFTFTVPGRPFFDNNWLTQLGYYGAFSAGGLEAVQFLNAALLAATFALLVRLCRRASGSTALAAAAGVGAFLGLWQTFLIRPQTVSMLLFVGLYGLLEAARTRPRLLLWAPPLMALWANVHGGFAVGLALIFSFVLGATWERWKTNLALPPGGEGKGEGEDQAPPFPLLACLVVSAAATLANPYGWNVYRYAGKLSSVGVARGIEEWLPPSLGSLNGAAFAASLALLAWLLSASKRRPTPREVCLLACFALPACFSTRMTVWWFLAAAPVMARLAAGGLRFGRRAETSAAPARNSPASAPSILATISLAMILCAVILSLPWLERYHPAMGTLRTARRTEADLQVLADQLPNGKAPARVFTRMEWANYLAWSASDRSSVFVEGRVELYPDDTWQRYLTVTEARPGWEGVLDGYGVDYLLLDETYHRALVERVGHSPRWSRQMRAGPAVLFARRNAAAPDAPPAPDLAGLDF